MAPPEVNDKEHETFKNDFSRLFKTIYGNGEHGLVTKNALNEQAIRALFEIERKRSNREWVVISGILLLIAKGVWDVMTQ